MSSINDDDLAINADIADRKNTSYNSIGVSGVRGGKALLSVFNAENKFRLFFMGAAAVLVVTVLFVVTMGVDKPAERLSQNGNINANTKISSTISDETPTFIEQQNIDRYNNDVLPELQKDDPTVHPLLEPLATDDYKAEEAELGVNPFEVDVEVVQPKNISQTLGISQNAEPQARQVIDYKGIDSVIESLIQAEGGSVTPRLSSVSWSYAELTNQDSDQQSRSETNTESNQAGISASQCPPYQIRSGSQELATTDLALNSDVGGPVSITLRSGKHRNAKLFGEFERAGDWLRIKLNRMSYGDETYDINAIALDAETTLNAVEGKVNRHVMYRYGWWGFGTILKAIGKGAEMNSDTRTVVSDGTVIQDTQSDSEREVRIMLGQFGQDLGGVMQDRLNRPITVTKNVGDEIGVYFLEDFCATSK